MKIELKFRDDDARRLQYFLQKRYKTKALLPLLIKTAIRETVGRQAAEELKELKT